MNHLIHEKVAGQFIVIIADGFNRSLGAFVAFGAIDKTPFTLDALRHLVGGLSIFTFALGLSFGLVACFARKLPRGSTKVISAMAWLLVFLAGFWGMISLSSAYSGGGGWERFDGWKWDCRFAALIAYTFGIFFAADALRVRSESLLAPIACMVCYVLLGLFLLAGLFNAM